MRIHIQIQIGLLVVVSLCTATVHAQSEQEPKDKDKAIKATNFSLPSSVAFNLLEVNPSQVHRPGFARDFKFDWLVKDNKIVSNLAVEVQPAWLLFYNNTDYPKLRKQKAFQRALSSLSLSVGTASKDSIRSFAWGAKINLFAKKNPLYDTSYIYRVGDFSLNDSLENKIDLFETKCRLETDRLKKDTCMKILDSLLNLKDSLGRTYNMALEAHLKSIESFKEQYEKDNWNSTLIDLGFGRIYNYFSASLDSLDFINQGGGVWLSGNFGIGKKVLINGMVKYGEVSNNEVTTFGANFRYGGLNANFFVEGLYNTASSDNLKKITIAYGGDIKFRTFALQFGLRTDYNKDFKFKNLIPVVNFNYLMNQ